jgi:uracil-DNA glycosylase
MQVTGKGPLDSKIVLVGEAPGEQEDITGRPFEGSSGQELTRMLGEAGIDRKQIYLTNVFSHRPKDNKLEAFCGKKADVGKDYPYPPLASGQYVLPTHLVELERLRDEINLVQPRLVIACGGTASWALLRAPKITSIRGTIAAGSLTEHKVLPTFHPSAVLRNWAIRPIVLQDLIKAERESHFAEIRRPERRVYYDPEYNDLAFYRQEILHTGSHLIGADIETKNRTITCISFAPSRAASFVIPFWDPAKPSGSYWPTLAIELEWWNFVQEVLSSSIPKVWQNGLYDLQYLLRMGISVRNSAHDTMILHHAMYPELQKSLGFLGSIYTNESSWKLLRPRGEDSNKREDE